MIQDSQKLQFLRINEKETPWETAHELVSNRDQQTLNHIQQLCPVKRIKQEPSETYIEDNNSNPIKFRNKKNSSQNVNETISLNKNEQEQNMFGKQKSVEKSAFQNLIFNVRMRSRAKKLAESIRSRMEQNLTRNQIAMIGDKALDIQQHVRKQLLWTDNFDQSSRKSIIFQFLQKIDMFLPVFDPRSGKKVLLEVMNLISILIIFYSLSVSIAFKLTIEKIIPPLILQISLGIICLHGFVNLNTGFYTNGILSGDRHSMFRKYYDSHFFVDFGSLLSTIFLLILNNLNFETNVSYEETQYTNNDISDRGTLIRFIIFLPFFFKVRDFAKFTQSFEEKVIFHPRITNYIQLLKLFSEVVLIDHLIACIWIFASKLSFNVVSNWQTSRSLSKELWFKQYTISFYFSTVTMVTVGYGDIIASNQTEYIICIFVMLISSGVFGFTLNQIGIIFSELFAEQKEIRRKMNIINIHMDRKNVSHALRTQIREYLDFVWKENNEKFAKDSSVIIDQLNDSLKNELQLHQNQRIIDYLRTHYSQNFIKKALTLIEEIRCKPQQMIYSSGNSDNISLYLIEKGKVEIFFKTKSVRQSLSCQNVIHVH